MCVAKNKQTNKPHISEHIKSQKMYALCVSKENKLFKEVSPIPVPPNHRILPEMIYDTRNLDGWENGKEN